MRGGRFHDPIVSGVLWHSAGDRKIALAQLRADFDALIGEVMSAPPMLQHALAPTIDAFNAFYQSETTSTLAPWITEWSVFEAWAERLGWARMAVRAAGVDLASPEPKMLPKTVWERGEDGTGSGGDRLLVFGRDTIKLGLGLAAVIGIWKALRHFRRELSAVEEEIDEEIATVEGEHEHGHDEPEESYGEH